MVDFPGPIAHPAISPLPSTSLYDSREARSRFVAGHFAALWQRSVLDVGCFRRELGAALPGGCRYVGIDLMGRPDVTVNLDGGRIPFADGSFDTVVCVDVLEHLERIHAVFDELLRVSRHRLLISLPNCWHGNWRWVLPGAAVGSGKYYGLPTQAPPDRHRWFFNTFEAVSFIRARAGTAGAALVYLDFHRPQSVPKRLAMRLLLSRNHWAWAPATIWAVLEK